MTCAAPAGREPRIHAPCVPESWPAARESDGTWCPDFADDPGRIVTSLVRFDRTADKAQPGAYADRLAWMALFVAVVSFLALFLAFGSLGRSR